MCEYAFLGPPMAKINQTKVVPPGRLTHGVGYRKIFSVGPYDVACGCTARHGWGATFSAHAIMPSHLGTARVYFFARERSFLLGRASFVHVIRYVRYAKQRKKCTSTWITGKIGV